MRKFLVLSTLALTMLVSVLAILAGARYVFSPVPMLQIGTALNMYVRPIIALAAIVVLGVRFKDIWIGVTDVNERMNYRITRFAHYLGLLMMGGALTLLVVVSAWHLAIPARGRAEIPLFFLFGPLIALMPIGYFVFEIGRAIDHDRQKAEI